MIQTSGVQFDVGGVLLPRPFKVRRLGHFGYYMNDLDAAAAFYTQLLGFRITDAPTMQQLLPPHLQHIAAGVLDPRMFFTSNGSDHHVLLFMHSSLAETSPFPTPPQMTTNQLTWQVGTLEEVVDAYHFLKKAGVPIVRAGRDMPGANWNVYFQDPDGFTVELYYGIEQIGWSRHSRPMQMYDRGFQDVPPLPQISEYTEIAEALERGVEITAGYRPQPEESAHDVGGVLLPRPFKVTKLGPVGLFVTDLSRSLDFYTRLLGFEVTETVEVEGHEAVFLRHGGDHHSLALYPRELRSVLGLSEHTVVASLGMEVGTYRQLRDAVSYLSAHGSKLIDLPASFSTGIDYAAHLKDPDGHLVQLYYYMEQIGWDGKPRPAHLRRQAESSWPATVAALSDTYVDQVFQGPLG
jgi:catechol 2,3-dioxygenase-like lactoylglutathione lyase family enzyme